MKAAKEFKAWQTAEEYIQLITKNPGKLSGSKKYELKKLIQDAVRQTDIELVRVMRAYLDNH